MLRNNRAFLKAHDWSSTPDIETDQQKNIPPPPYQKEYPEEAILIDLIKPEKIKLGQISLMTAINNRKSRRGFINHPFTLEELSFLLWVTQGIKEFDNDLRHGAKTSKRTVPSGGSRHPFETYLVINKVESLESGIYRYLAVEHKLLFVQKGIEFVERVAEICIHQNFISNAGIIFLWAVIPYRSEWRYNIAAHKSIAIEVGHICQNLYLACEAIEAGTCAIAAYHQESIDSLLQLDGSDEFIIYIAPVGKIKVRRKE